MPSSCPWSSSLAVKRLIKWEPGMVNVCKLVSCRVAVGYINHEYGIMQHCNLAFSHLILIFVRNQAAQKCQPRSWHGAPAHTVAGAKFGRLGLDVIRS